MTHSDLFSDHTLPLYIAISIKVADSALGYFPFEWRINGQKVDCFEMTRHILHEGDDQSRYETQLGIVQSRLN